MLRGQDGDSSRRLHFRNCSNCVAGTSFDPPVDVVCVHITSFRACSPQGGMSCSLQEVGKQLLSPSLSLGYFHLLLNFVAVCSVIWQGRLNEGGYVPYSSLSFLSTILWLPGCESPPCLREGRSAQLLNSQCMNIKKAS